MLPPPELGGPEQRMGPKLYTAFVAAGLPAPTVRIDTPVGGGPDWPGYGVHRGDGAQPAADADRDRRRARRARSTSTPSRTACAHEIVSQDAVQPLVPVYGASTRVA